MYPHKTSSHTNTLISVQGASTHSYNAQCNRTEFIQYNTSNIQEFSILSKFFWNIKEMCRVPCYKKESQTVLQLCHYSILKLARWRECTEGQIYHTPGFIQLQSGFPAQGGSQFPYIYARVNKLCPAVYSRVNRMPELWAYNHGPVWLYNSSSWFENMVSLFASKIILFHGYVFVYSRVCYCPKMYIQGQVFAQNCKFKGKGVNTRSAHPHSKMCAPLVCQWNTHENHL